MTALSVSNSMTGSPSCTWTPGETITRTKSPDSMFSPNSGSLNSIATISPFVRGPQQALYLRLLGWFTKPLDLASQD